LRRISKRDRERLRFHKPHGLKCSMKSSASVHGMVLLECPSPCNWIGWLSADAAKELTDGVGEGEISSVGGPL